MSALDDLRFLEKRFRGILDLIPTLEKVSSLEGQEKELSLAVDKLKSDYVSAKEDLAKASDGITAATLQAQAIVQNAIDQSEAILDNAAEEDKEIISLAKSEAASIIADAKSEADKIVAKEASKASLLAELDKKIAEQTDKLSALNAELSKIKAKF